MSIRLYLLGHDRKYECEKIARLFFPTETFEFLYDEAAVPFESGISAQMLLRDNAAYFSARAKLPAGEDSETFRLDLSGEPDDGVIEKCLGVCMVRLLSRLTGIVPPWGILTGVRPSKLMLRNIRQFGTDGAEKIFRDKYLVSEEKTRLASTVALAEKEYIDLSERNSFSLYVSVPFCPTRCSYCSFVSHSIAQAKKLIPDYVRLLCEEIAETAVIAKEKGLRLETVYIGGGTPTSLSAEDISVILETLNRCFDAKNCREFTVEAGRPDTITEEKLRVMKNAGVGRISINPQTFSDRVLEKIGRKHTAADILEKYALARRLGFDNVNMDFIAGLPGDNAANFREGMEKAVSLRPENITVHTLALKTSANLVTEKETDSVCADTPEMLASASRLLGAAGYHPYYMYRQSKSVGNLENVGYSLPGRECLYNIYMMEEIHTVLAVGGGAVTKLIDPDTRQLTRVYNFKYPYEYVSRFPELIERKKNMILPGTEG